MRNDEVFYVEHVTKSTGHTVSRTKHRPEHVELWIRAVFEEGHYERMVLVKNGNRINWTKEVS